MKTSFISLCIFVCMIVTSIAQDLPIVIEAESGVLGSDYEILDENGMQFVRPKTDLMNGNYPGDDSKVITYTIQFDEPGEYHLYVKMRVGAGTWDDDSFFVGREFGIVSATNPNHWYNVNGLAQVGHTNSFDVVSGGGNVGWMVWKWLNVSEFLNAQSPVVYIVEDIENPITISIGAREDNFDIDKIAFANANLDYTVSNLELLQPGSPIGGFPEEAYRKVLTYVDPILPGAHPDMTLLRVGDDFYSTGSSFHITPYLPIYHSTDLVHWEVISRVVSPDWGGTLNDSPSGGIWQGALAEFGGFFWVYYSINSQQYFSKATSMEGPWTAPARVTASTVTGYDNSVFVDDDGTPYMLMKNGKWINRIQEINANTGQLTGTLLDLDWINAEEDYSWAEGPVMCKRDDWYYYFIAGNVGGGQWVLRTSEITDDADYWEELGPFFMSITDPNASFRGPNHLTQPVQLDDGTWWALSHSFQNRPGDDWSGKGRQGLLHQVLWDENGKPSGTAPTSKPQLKPDLPKSGIPWNLPRSDYFNDASLKLNWYFLNRTAASRYSLGERNGWLTLNPGNNQTHVLHKEGGYYFTLTTKLDFDATMSGNEAGLYLTNGNESITSKVYSGYNEGNVIGFKFTDDLVGNEVKYEVENTIGKVLWLKVERDYHDLKAYYSADGIDWLQIGDVISAINLDKEQPNYNWWIGTSNGLFASGRKAQFEKYLYRDGFFGIPAIGHNNHFGVETKGTGNNRAITNSSEKGGWILLGGVDMGRQFRVPASIEIDAASASGGTLEVWINDLENEGIKIAEVNITNTGGESNWAVFSEDLSGVSGQHDLYLRWNGPANAFLVRNIRFNYTDSFLSNIDQEFSENIPGWNVYPNPFIQNFTIESTYPESSYKLYNMSGILIGAGFIYGNSIHIESGNLSPGMYLLELDSDNQVQVIKLIQL